MQEGKTAEQNYKKDQGNNAQFWQGRNGSFQRGEMRFPVSGGNQYAFTFCPHCDAACVVMQSSDTATQ